MVSFETLNKILIIILIIIGMFIISSFLEIDLSSKIKKIPSELKSDLSDATLNDGYCEENIVPDKVTFDMSKGVSEHAISSSYYFRSIMSPWKDGTPISVGDISDQLTYNCEMGKEEGQNLNYLYCDYLIYSKTEIEEDGTIGGTINYKINLVLNEKNKYKDELIGKYNKVINNVTLDVVEYQCYKQKE